MKSRLLIAALLSVSVSAAFASDAMTFAVDPAPLVVSSANGQILFDVEIADTDRERAAGLMFRLDFPKNRAMLFDFKMTRPVSMWMKNTPLSLDMLFVDQTGLIVGISENTTPQSLKTISSPKPVSYVVELNAGQVEANSIETGDQLLHPAIKP